MHANMPNIASGVATAARPYSTRKQRTLEQTERSIRERENWIDSHRFYYEEDWRYMRFLIPNGKRVLDLGCGSGDMLAALGPSAGTGVDFSPAMVDRAKSKHPDLNFVHGDVEQLSQLSGIDNSYDIIVMSDTIGVLDDCVETLRSLHKYCTPDTRVIVSYRSRMWEPLLLLYARLTTTLSARPANWLSSADIANLFHLADFDVIKREWRMLCPFRLFGLGRVINRYIATLPLIRKLGIRNYVVARPRPKALPDLSTTVVIPCRNERGNIEPAVTRLPRFCPTLDIVFVEGGSADGTWEEIQRVIEAHPDVSITAIKQPGIGKGDAVRAGFAAARGDVLAILDADLTMPPEDMPKFYDALIAGKGEFINGSRLVYPMEKLAMRLLNQIANYLFAALFSYLLNQRYTDTLCGTKVLLRGHYEDIARNRKYFGEFDPFGDFDLIFGASKLNLKTAEIPIRYAARGYGETNISRFRHGWMLLRMVVFAFAKFKAI